MIFVYVIIMSGNPIELFDHETRLPAIMARDTHLNLVPPLVESGHIEDLIQAGQSLRASFSPLNNTVAVFVTSAVGWRVSMSNV